MTVSFGPRADLSSTSQQDSTARWQPLAWALPLLGVAVGVATSFLQGWLADPWSSLANSASPWLLAAFLVGCAQRSRSTAAVSGAVTCVGAVVGYYGASAARGFGISDDWVIFWFLCGIVAGPVFGACGRLARGAGSRVTRSVGAAAPAATFLGEGIGSYWLRLGYHQDAVLFVAVGVVAALLALLLAPGRVLTVAVIAVGTVGGALVYDVALRVLG